jgi:hypothetical protein
VAAASPTDTNGANNAAAVTSEISQRPTVHLTVEPTSGVYPLVVTAHVDAAHPDGDALAYTLYWGDGGQDGGPYTAGQTVQHTYNINGLFAPTARVSDDGFASYVTDSAVVSVSLPTPLMANAGPDLATTAGEVHGVTLDGSASSPADAIRSYSWHVTGPGGFDRTLSGAVVSRLVLPDQGNYNVALTVDAGTAGTDTDSAVINVGPTAPNVIVTVTDGVGGPALDQADVAVVGQDGTRYSGSTDSTGTTALAGLPDGSYEVFVAKTGYQAGKGTVTATGAGGAVTVALDRGQLATATIDAHRITATEAAAVGVDLTDPANQHDYKFEIHLAFIDTPVVFTGYTSPGGFFGAGFGGGGGGGGGCSFTCYIPGSAFGSGGRSVLVSVVYVEDIPQIVYLVIPGEAKWLKEFYDVTMTVQNLAPAGSGFVLTNGIARLDLPTRADGVPALALPALFGQNQANPQDFPDVAGGESKSVHWIVRGDTEGFYYLTAHYAARLDPVGLPVLLDATTTSPIHVWAGSALHMIVDADSDVYDRYPYHVRIGLTNVADVPVYNVSVELLKQGKLNYIYQPREQFVQGTDEIAPGATFWTQDYILAPQIGGHLDLQDSFVKKTAGDVDLADEIISHTPAQTPGTAPELDAIGLHNRIGLIWDAVPGATAYQVYATPDRTLDFPDEPIAVVDGSQTQTVVDLPVGATGWYAVSAIVGGRNTMYHPIAEGRATDHAVEPTVSVTLSSQASCGNDIKVAADFSDTFFDLANYTVELDGQPLESGPVSGRTGTAIFTVPASRIADADSTLTISASDTTGDTGPAWTDTISRGCDPLNVLVLGDSIAWGQGLSDNQKFATLVKNDLHASTGRHVVVNNLAHSGAVLGSPTDGCTPDFQAQFGDGAGEVPSEPPSILGCEIPAARGMPADLILMDGCINDVNVINGIINLDADVKRLAAEKCASLQTALLQVHADHPHAKVVLTGYYPIVSAYSAVTVGALIAAFNLRAGLEVGKTLLEEAQHSTDFYDAYNEAAQTAMQDAKTTDPSDWLVPADPKFSASDAIFSPVSSLWIGLNDSVRSDRSRICKVARPFRLLHPTTYGPRLKCEVASIGHPNVAGAKKYEVAIMDAIGPWVSTWGTHVSAGGTGSSDPPATPPTSLNPVIATVTSPHEGTLSFTKTPGTAPLGYSALGVGVVISAPAATPEQPLSISFDIDASTLPPGTPLSSVTVFRDHTAVGACTGAAATPDPCVSARSLSSGILSVTVLTSHASTWDFGIADRPADTAPVFTSSAPPSVATVGVPFSYTYLATGSPAPTFGVASGSLPAGLTLDPATGVLSGTPTTDGTFSFAMSASNTAGSVSASATIVVSVALSSIAVSPTAATIPVGTIQAYTAIGTFSDGSTQDITGTVTWSVPADATVATISATGEALGQVAGGPVTVTAALGAVSATATLMVSPAALSSIAVTPAIASAAKGTTRQFTATGTLTDGTTTDFTATAVWSSSDPAVSAIASGGNASPGLASMLATGNTIITASQGGMSGTANLTVTPSVLNSVVVSPPTASAAPGTTRQFSAVGSFSDGTTQDLTGQAAWTSSDTIVATITTAGASGSPGLALALTTGTSTITATVNDLAGTAALTVSAATVTSLAVAPASSMLPQGASQQLTAIATFSDGSSQNVTDRATWTSASPATATVSSGGLAQGVKPGKTTITAKFASKSAKSAVTVTAPIATELRIAPLDAHIAKGLSVPYLATAVMSNGSVRQVTRQTVWSTGSITVATFAGKAATGVGVGQTTVTATFQGLTASAPLTVTPAVLRSIRVAPTKQTLVKGTGLQFTATGTYTDGPHDITNIVVWTSTKPAVAGCNATGYATGVSKGNTTITAGLDTISGKVTLKVS